MTNSTATSGTANDGWTQAAGKAREASACVSEMASNAVTAVETMASQAACDARKKADDLTARAGAGIHELGDTITKNAPHTGVLGDASQAVARKVREGGEYLENAKLSGMTEDVARLIRRNPIPSVLIAIGLGWFVAHKLRS